MRGRPARAGEPAAGRLGGARRARRRGGPRAAARAGARPAGRGGLDGAAAARARGRALGRPLDARPRRLPRARRARRADRARRHLPQRRDARGGRRCAPGWPSSRAPTGCGGSSSSRSARRRSPSCWRADPADRAASIARRSGGNAFLAEELYEAGGDEATLPASIRDLLGVRIAALPPPAQAVLRAAAAAGARVDDELLAALVDLPASRARGRAPRGRRAPPARPIRATAGSRFRHELVREAAYAELLPGERRRLHAACARVLEERPELGESPASAAASVARHWDAAGDARRALAACLRAADAAQRRARPGGGARALPARARRCRDRDRHGSTSSSAPPTPAVQAGEAERRARAARRGARARRSRRRAGARRRPALAARLVLVGGRRRRAVHVRAPRPRARPDPGPAAVGGARPRRYRPGLHGHARRPHAEALERALEAVARRPRRRCARDRRARAQRPRRRPRHARRDTDAAIECLREAVAIARETGGTEALGRAYVNLSAGSDIAGRYDEAVEVALEGAAASRPAGTGPALERVPRRATRPSR